ncbi:MAG: AAA family ATPase [Candidatus Omnitrophica bacterium]|nr:AAA family ATPase [Candidatus Omnitrophota bacterium]
MSLRIAFSGKGGSGKTTLAALTIKFFIERKLTPILAVDADPNSNLNIALDLELTETIADVREEVLENKTDTRETKNEFVFRRINEILVESDKVDLLAMGRPEGPGCYCAINHLLREYLSKISRNYKVVVIDTEAGMEHLSRRTTDDLDILFIVATIDPVSLTASFRIQDITQKLKLKIKNKYLILNRFNSASPAFEKFEKESLNLLGTIPEDEELNSCWKEGGSIIKIENSIAFQKLSELLFKFI